MLENWIRWCVGNVAAGSGAKKGAREEEEEEEEVASAVADGRGE